MTRFTVQSATGIILTMVICDERCQVSGRGTCIAFQVIKFPCSSYRTFTCESTWQAPTSWTWRPIFVAVQEWKVESGIDKPHGFLLSGDVADAKYISKQAQRFSIANADIYVNTYNRAANIIRSVLFDGDSVDVRRILAIPGNHGVERGGKALDTSGPYVCDPYEKQFAAKFSEGADFTLPVPPASVSCLRLCLFGGDNGVIALVGLDSNHSQYWDYNELSDHGLVRFEQLERFARLAKALSTSVNDRPLHIVVAIH